MWQKNLLLIKWTDYVRRTISHHSQYFHMETVLAFQVMCEYSTALSRILSALQSLTRAAKPEEHRGGGKTSFTQTWIHLSEEMLCPGMGCTDSPNSFPMPLLNISPMRCLEAKERTIYVGSVLQVVPLSCFCTSWPWYARIVLPWAEFPHDPCMPLGEPCFTLVCKWHRCSQKASRHPKHILLQTPTLPSQSHSPLQAFMKSMTKSSSQTKWIPPTWVISDDS